MSLMRMTLVVIGGVLAAASGLLRPAHAADGAAATPYSGDFVGRSTLTGDWAGVRNDLAAKGITLGSTVTQITQGVVGGGKHSNWVYGGRGDLKLALDTQKLGLWPGGFLSAELEGNWNESVYKNVGALSPPNTNQLFPVANRNNVALPQLMFAQFVSPYAGALVGKFDTMSGDQNAFAHGKGDTQFFNLAFNINPALLAVPYSTLGAGILVLPTKDPHEATLQFSMLSATGKATTTGFDNINGAIFVGQGRVRTDFFERTGHQLVGALYSNRQYKSLDQRIADIIDNQPLAKSDDTWAVFYNFDQFLYEIDKAAGRGVGLFGRFGASKGDPVPFQYFYSAGLGSKGLVASRPLDQIGIGYYYSDVRNPTLQTPQGTLSLLRSEWGFEAYYSAALTPWLMLTGDLQVIGPAQSRKINRDFVGPGTIFGSHIGTATVLGCRLHLIL